MKKVIQIALAVLCLSFPSWASTFFVTQSGAGAANGTSLGNAWPVATFNGSSLPTGDDRVCFSGTITSTVTPNTSGSSGHLLILDFSGSASCPGTTAATLNTANPRISITGKNFLDIIGGTFGTSSSGTLIAFNHAIHNGNVVEGWTYVGGAGGTATPLDMYYPQNFTVKNNSFDNVGGLGYSDTTNTHDILISGNFIRTSNNTAQQTDVITLGDAANVTIEKNRLINQAPGSNTNGRHNDVIQTFQSGSTPNGTPTNWIIRYNWIEVAQADGSGGNMSWHELENFAGQPALQIYGNVYVGNSTSWNGGNGISLHSATNASDTYFFYNNTVVRHTSPLNPLRLGEGDGPGTLFFRNNAMYSDATSSGDSPQITFTAGAQWNRNFFFRFGDATATHAGPNGSTSTNPNFVDPTNNNFSLAAGSALINAGDSTIGASYNQGPCSGQTAANWPNPTLCTRSAGNWDVGAFQTNGVSTVNTPQFSPGAGTYGSTQSISITVASPSAATICYTTDGSTPTADGAGTCVNGTTYSTPVTVSTSQTLKAIGSKSGFADSAVASATYVIGTLPTADLSITAFSFGNQRIGNGTQTIVNLANNGTGTLTISSIALTIGTQFTISANTCGASLPASSNCNITITFNPSSAGQKTDTLTFTDNAATSPQTVTFSGTGVIAIQSNSIGVTTSTDTSLAYNSSNTAGNMSVVCVRGGTAGEAFTVTDSKLNTYNQAVFLSDATSGNTVAIYYATNISAGANTVRVQQSISSTLRYAILEYTGYTALDVTSSSTGTGTSVTSGAASTTSNGDLIVGCLLGSGTHTITPTNGFNLEQAISSPPATKLIAQDVTQSTAGSIAATATLDTSDQWAGTMAAFSTVATTPKATPSPTSLTFGTQNVSTTSVGQNITLANNGTAALALTTISLTGTNSADFFQSNNCPTGGNLGINSSCTITVTFTPTATGVRSASVQVTDNAADNPQTILLSGTGVAPSNSSALKGGITIKGGFILK